MNSMAAKHGPQSKPWDPIGDRQTMQTGGSTTSAAALSIVRQAGARTGPVSPIHIAPIIVCPRRPEEMP